MDNRTGTTAEIVEVAHETLVESARELRDLAQQCYLLIGPTNDARLKMHLLAMGVDLEQRTRLIECRAQAAQFGA